MRKILSALVATLVALTMTAAVAATPAAAAAAPMKQGVATVTTATGVQPDSFADCPSGVTCIWYDINGGGTKGVISYSQNPPGTCWNLPTGPVNWRNVISSTEVQFGSGWGVHWWGNTGCTGVALAQPHLTRANMTDWCCINDEFESFYLEQL